MSEQQGAPRRWTAEQVPDQAGRVAVITGANTGIGYEAARVLAARGAQVVLACRNLGKAKEAADRIQVESPDARLKVLGLDLSSLASVREASAELHATQTRIDLLVNNAGVMMAPYAKTVDGYELQLGTNHLGHFALTGLVLDQIREVPGSRIVTISSGAHQFGRIDFDDLQSERSYRRAGAYGQSKLANLLFTYELQRRLEAAGAATIAVAAHPGGSKTELDRHLPGFVRAIGQLTGNLLTQSAAMGALPTLRAAVDARVQGGDYYGPGGFMEMRGYPVQVRSSGRSHDRETQERLWQVSEELTGVSYAV